MKRTLIVFLLALVYLFVGQIKAYSQQGLVLEPNSVFYWFFVNVKIDEKSDSYKVISAQNNINVGSLNDFEKDLWQSLANRKIIVGPFLEKNEAINAKRLYRSSEDRVKQLPVDTVPQNVYWFAIDFKQSDRMRIFIIVRNPAAIQSGNEQRFIAAFYEQLAYKHFAIGPYYSYDEAELAKRLYRKNE